MARIAQALSSAPSLALLALLVLPVSTKAQQGRSSRAGVSETMEQVADVVFGEVERRLIVEFFAGNTPVRGKRLPPGIRKNLARGKPLPPGIAKQVLPIQLEDRLPPRDGYERVIVGTDVLLVSAVTGLIVDVLRDVF
jgi:hypothetical protein